MSRNSNGSRTSSYRPLRSHSGGSTSNQASPMSRNSNDNRSSSYRTRCSTRSMSRSTISRSRGTRSKSRESCKGGRIDTSKTRSPLHHDSSIKRISNQHSQERTAKSIRSSLCANYRDGLQSTRQRSPSRSSNSRTRSFEKTPTKIRSRISQVELQGIMCGYDFSGRDQCPKLLKNVLKELRDLTKTVVNYQHQNDRRLSRMEVSINKTLVRIGDITRLNDGRSTNAEVPRDSQEYSSGNEHEQRKDRRDYTDGARRQILSNDRKCPELPIGSLNEVNNMCERLKADDFFLFLVNFRALY